MTRNDAGRSLRDWLQLLRAEIVDLATRAIVAAFDPGARTQPPTIVCAHCAARARAAGHTVIPTQNGPTAAEQAPGDKVTAALAAVPPPPVLPGKTLRVGVVQATCPTCGTVEIPDSRTISGVFYQAYPDLSWYGFTCPTCHERITRQAVEPVRAALAKVATGILIDTAPAEILEQHPTGTLDADAVLDAILELDTHDNLAALAADAHQPADPAGQPREIDLRDGDR